MHNNDYENLGGNTQDLTEAVQSLVTKALGDVVPELVPLLNLIIPHGISRAFGDTVAEGFWTSNQTAMGVYQGRATRNIGLMAKAVSKDITGDFMHEVFDSYVRTVTGFDTWRNRAENAKLSEAEAKQGYEDFVQSEVQGWLQKPFVGSLFSFANGYLDIGGSYTAAKALQATASNLATWGMQDKGWRHGMIGGRELASNLLTGDWNDQLGGFDNTKRFNAAEWGGMGIGAVATIAEQLTRSTDFLSGVDTSKTEDLKKATEHFRMTVKEYSEALAPLKDVFGDETGRMIDVLQNLTGTSLAHMSTLKAANLATAITDRVNSGQASVTEIMSSTADMTRRLSGMAGLGTYNYLTGTEQGIAALDAFSGGGFQPSYRTNAQFKSLTQSLVSETYNSRAADLIARGYSLWAHKNKNREGGTSTAEFQRLVDEQAATGVDPRRAIFNLAGATNDFELNEGTLYDDYRKVIESGESGLMSMRWYIAEEQRNGMLRASLDPVFLKAIGEGNTELAQQRYNDVLALVDKNPNIEKMSSAERIAYLTENGASLGVGWHGVNGSVSTTYTEADAKMVNEALNRLRADRVQAAILDKRIALKNAENAAAISVRARNRREALRQIDKKIATTGTGLYSLFSGGYSDEKLKERLALGYAVELAGADLDEVSGILGAFWQQADNIYGRKVDEKTGKILQHENNDAVAKLAGYMYSYAMSADGLANSGFNQALYSYIGMSEAQKKGTEGKAELNKMLAYTEANADVIDKFYSMDVYDDRGNKLEGAAAEDRRNQLMSAYITRAYSDSGEKLSDLVKWGMVDSQVAGLDENTKKGVAGIISDYKAKADKGSDGFLQVGENWSKVYEEKKKQIESSSDSAPTKRDKLRVLEETNKILEAAASGKRDNTILTDLYGVLKDILAFFREGGFNLPKADGSAEDGS